MASVQDWEVKFPVSNRGQENLPAPTCLLPNGTMGENPMLSTSQAKRKKSQDEKHSRS